MGTEERARRFCRNIVRYAVLILLFCVISQYFFCFFVCIFIYHLIFGLFFSCLNLFFPSLSRPTLLYLSSYLLPLSLLLSFRYTESEFCNIYLLECRSYALVLAALSLILQDLKSALLNSSQGNRR